MQASDRGAVTPMKAALSPEAPHSPSSWLFFAWRNGVGASRKQRLELIRLEDGVGLEDLIPDDPVAGLDQQATRAAARQQAIPYIRTAASYCNLGGW